VRLPLRPGPGGDDAPASPAQWRDGLRLTAHFLERDAFGHLHRPLTAARQLLGERVAAMV
jgi:DNA repair protein RecO (recombination protein O)